MDDELIRIDRFSFRAKIKHRADRPRRRDDDRSQVSGLLPATTNFLIAQSYLKRL